MKRRPLRERLGGIAADVRTLDPRVVTVLVSAAVALTFLEFGPIRHAFGGIGDARTGPPDLKSLTSWSVGCLLAYLVFPMIVMLVAFGDKPWNLGLNFRGFLRHLPIYVGLYLLVAPVILLAFKLFPETSRVYPFYRQAGDRLEQFIRWQLIYGLQFLSLEFFFRGFLLFGLEKRFGYHAILVMVVPYCMIHFRKTWQESLAAVIAGLALGYLAMKTRSVLGGVFIHWAIAITADIAAIMGRGGFGVP